MQMAENDRSDEKDNGHPRVGALEVWRSTSQLLKQYLETSVVVAAQRADSAFAAGRMLNFRLWVRVTAALTDFLRERTSSDIVN